MARVTLKSQAIIIAQLEAQVAELTTTKGILMSEVESLKQELSDVQHNTFTRDEVNQLIELEVADRMATKPPASQPKRPAPKPLPAPAAFDSAPVISITDADKRVWSKFQALPREQKQAYYDFAHNNGFGHLGIHNVNQVRVAFLAAKAA